MVKLNILNFIEEFNYKYLDIDSIISRVLIENLKTNSQLIFYLQTIDYSRVKIKIFILILIDYFLFN